MVCRCILARPTPARIGVDPPKYPPTCLGACDGERLGDLGARSDLELSKHASQVVLDRLFGHEQRLGDLAVRHALGGHPGDA